MSAGAVIQLVVDDSNRMIMAAELINQRPDVPRGPGGVRLNALRCFGGTRLTDEDGP